MNRFDLHARRGGHDIRWQGHWRALILPILLVLLAASAAAAQEGPAGLLTGGDARSWTSSSVEVDDSAMAIALSITFNADGSYVAFGGEATVTGRWMLADDGKTLVMFEKRSGGDYGEDTTRIALEELTDESLVISMRDESSVVRIRYGRGDQAPSPATDGFEAFWERFKKAVAKNDKKAVAAMTSFPFMSYDLPSIAGKPRHEPAFTREEFLKYYGKLFDKRAKYLISVSKPTPMTGDDDTVTHYAVGIRGGADYTIWIEFWRDDNGAWWLARTDNVSQ